MGVPRARCLSTARWYMARRLSVRGSSGSSFESIAVHTRLRIDPVVISSQLQQLSTGIIERVRQKGPGLYPVGHQGRPQAYIAAVRSYVLQVGDAEASWLRPRSSHPDFAFRFGREHDGRGLRMDRLDDGVRFGRQECVNVMLAMSGALIGPLAPVQRVWMPASAKTGCSSLETNQRSGFLPVSGSASCSYSENAVAGTRQRFWFPSHCCQCGIHVLRTLVTPLSGLFEMDFGRWHAPRAPDKF